MLIGCHGVGGFKAGKAYISLLNPFISLNVRLSIKTSPVYVDNLIAVLI